MPDRSVLLRSCATSIVGLVAGLLVCSVAFAQGPPPEPRLWSSVSAMDVLAEARICSADPACTLPEPPDGLVVDPGTGQALLSVHVKGATGVAPLLDWAAQTAGAEAEGKELLVFGETGHIIDLALDLLDLTVWDGLVAVLDAMAVDAFVSLHGVPTQASGAHPDLIGVHGLVQACAGDDPCLKGVVEGRPWLDPWAGVAAIQIDVPHGSAPGEQDTIVAELASLAWADPPVPFEITSMLTGEVIARAHGRLPTDQLDGLQAWFDGQSFSAWTRPMTGDELSMVRLTLPVVEAAAELAACGGQPSCHHDVSTFHQVVASPAGRLGIIFQGEDPDIAGLNGLEYPGWSMAPPGYMVDGATGLLSFDSLRDVAQGRWGLAEALSIKPDDNPGLLGLSLADWLAAWTADDVPLLYSGTADLDGDGHDSTAHGGGDCDDEDPEIHPGAEELFNCIDDDCDGSLLPGEGEDADGDGWLACDDCDDGNPDIHPGGDDGWVPGNCDGLDSDCDGLLGPDETDDDGDGFSECDGDMDDTDPGVQGPPPAPQLWSAVSAMDVLAAVRSCQAEPTCAQLDVPAGLVTDPATGQPLLSVHSKGAMDIGPLLDWAAATPGVEVDSKLVHVFDMTGHEVDVSMDLLDPAAWAGLRDALELIGADAYASLHGVHQQFEGAHPALASAEASISACGGDVPCLDQLHESDPWLSPFEGLGAVQLEVPHDGQAGKHDSIVAELEGLSWGDPAIYFAVDDGAGHHQVRALGRLAVSELTGLQAWLDGQLFDATSRPLSEDELSMVRLQLSVAEAAADLLACFGDPACHHAVGQDHGAVVSPAGRLGIVFNGEDPDIEGLNGLEYPGWSMAPAGYVMDGAAGLLAHEPLRDLGLGRWGLGEALSVGLDGNPEITLLPVEDWLAWFAPDDTLWGWAGDDDDSAVAGGDDDTVQDDDDVVSDDDDSAAHVVEPRPIVTASWLAPSHENPACGDAAVGAFAPTAAGYLTPPPPPTPGWSDFLLPSFPPTIHPGGEGATFFQDYLHCRAALADADPLVVPDPYWCYGVLASVPADFQDLFEVAKGTPLVDSPMPVLVQWPEVGDPSVTHWADIVHRGWEPAAVQLSAALLPNWAVWIESDPLVESTSLWVEGYVHAEGTQLSLDYEEVLPTTDQWTEHVKTPDWIWRFTAEYELGFDSTVADALEALPWRLWSVVVEPVVWTGMAPSVTFSGELVDINTLPIENPALSWDDLANHTEEVVGQMVNATVTPYFQASEQPFSAHLVTTAVMTNPVIAGAPPWSWEILALDAVELYESSYVDPTCVLSSIPDAETLGIAPVLKASPAQLPQPSDIPMADPFGPDAFLSVELDDASAQDISTQLGMSDALGIADFSDSFVVSGPGLPGGEKRNALQETRLVDLFERLVQGTLDWTVAEEPGSYDCFGPADDLQNACVQANLGTVWECLGSHWYPMFDACSAGRALSLEEVEAPAPVTPNGITCMSLQSAHLAPSSLSSIQAGAYGTPGCSHEPPSWGIEAETGTVTLNVSECAIVTVPLSVGINFTSAAPVGPDAPAPECPNDFPLDTPRSQLAPRLVPPMPGVWEEGLPQLVPDLSLDVNLGVAMSFAVTAQYSIPMWMYGLDYYDGISDCLPLPDASATLWSWDEVDTWLEEMAGEIEKGCYQTLSAAGLPIPSVEYSLYVQAQDPELAVESIIFRGGFPSVAWLLEFFVYGWPVTFPQAPNPEQLDLFVPIPGLVLPEEWSDQVNGNTAGLSGLTDGLGLTLPLASLSQDTLRSFGLLANEPREPSTLEGGMASLVTRQLLAGADVDDLAPLMLALRSGNTYDADCPSILNDLNRIAGCGNYLHGNGVGQGFSFPNAFVGSYQFLLERAGFYEAGWPTRAAVVRDTLDLACGTMSLPGAGSCVDHVIISFASEQATGADGALWFFRPDPALSAGWQPGRLP